MIREPKNADLVVAPSVFTEQTRSMILQAIARYKNTGQKPVSVPIGLLPSDIIASDAGRVKTKNTRVTQPQKQKYNPEFPFRQNPSEKDCIKR